MVQQRPLAGRADAGDFLQAGLADVAPAPDAVRPDCETMRLVALPLHEVEHGIARPELERLASRLEESFEPGVAIRSLGDGDERHVRYAKSRQRLLRGGELPAAAVDDDEIGPGRLPLVVDVRI